MRSQEQEEKEEEEASLGSWRWGGSHLLCGHNEEATPEPHKILFCPPLQHHPPIHLFILGRTGTPGLPAEPPVRTIPVLPGSTEPALPTASTPVFLPAPLPLPHAPVPDASAVRRLPLHITLWPQCGSVSGLLPRPPIRTDGAAATFWERG